MEKPGLRFEDLGLTVKMPDALLKTAEQKKKEKLEGKKAYNARTKEAMEAHGQVKDLVQRHREFVEEEEARMRAEKQARRRDLEAEHIKAQNKRALDEKLRDRSVIAQQANIIEEVKQFVAQTEKKEQELLKLIRAEDDRQLKTGAPALCIPVNRDPLIEESRSTLPVLREEQQIMESVLESRLSCVLVCGETGSGKTTQVPQFLWECGFSHQQGEALGRSGMICVTEPRRVAAVAMARRVAEELNEEFGGKVGYQVRYDNNLSSSCQLKFVTEGILLREIQEDFLLKRYSVIVIDEAHERSISCDILVGMLSRIVPLRQHMFDEGATVGGVAIAPLKMIVMSATMRVSDFKDNRLLFPKEPPLVNVEARRFPVTNHFSKRTELHRYCDEAFKKVCQIHKKLPPGGILVFLSTQREIEALCTRLKRHYHKTKILYDESNFNKHALLARKKPAASTEAKDNFGLVEEQYALDDDDNKSNDLSQFGLRDDFDYGQISNVDADKEYEAEEVVDTADSDADEGESETDFHEGDESDHVALECENEDDGKYDTLHILPLFALLNFTEQQRVFVPPPKGTRLCIVATNVAETSITIPGIKYVVDSGRVKNKKLDASSGASSFAIEWTSQASAEQRSGRAGRTGPGHCYRLFSTAVYTNLMSKHSVPEILRTPVESVVLMMKSLCIDHVSKFPFPTPPRAEDLEIAFKHLIAIQALERTSLRITPLGAALLHFPVAPRFAKMIVTAVKTQQSKLIEQVVAIVAIASTTLDVFEHGTVQECSRKTPTSRVTDQKRFIHAGSDLITFLRVMGYFGQRPSVATTSRLNVVHKTLTEATQLRKQLLAALRTMDKLEDSLFNEGEEALQAEPGAGFDSNGDPLLTKDAEILLRKLIAIGLIDQVARRATVHECRARGIEYTDGKTTKVPYLDCRSATIVYVHPSSTVAATQPPPEFVTYCGLQLSKRGDEDKKNHTFMKGVTVMTKQWLDEIDFDEAVISSHYRRALGGKC